LNNDEVKLLHFTYCCLPVIKETNQEWKGSRKPTSNNFVLSAI